jgi:transposase
MSRAEKKALDIEIRKSFIENEMQYRTDEDAAILYLLHEEYGFGKKRLRKFWDRFNKLHDELIRHYLVEDYETPWICKEKLKNIGIDIDEWERESNART